MTVVRIISTVGLAVMGGAIAIAFATGDFSSEGAQILGLAWGRVTLIDLYVGLTFFGFWMFIRERRWWVIGLWWLGLVTLGNLAAALYLTLAGYRSTDLRQLLLGESRS